MEDRTEEEKQAGSPGKKAADIEIETPKDALAEDEDNQVIELLRKPGLSIKYLDEPTKDRIRRFIQRTHVERGISLTDISKMIGNKTSGYTSWLTRQLGVQPRAFEEARLKGIKEKRRKYERKPFDGTDEDRAYLLGFRHGDLHVYAPWRGSIRVSTSTTHPALVQLFRQLFEQYGHVYQHPRYKSDTRSYEWNLESILDESFAFLQEERAACQTWVSASEQTSLAYLAGLIDAEGTITIYGDKDNTAVILYIYNTDLVLLNYAADTLKALGFSATRPYLNKRKGFRTPGYHIEMKKDYWAVAVSRFLEVQSLLTKLPLRHQEKVMKKSLALSLTFRQPWESVRLQVGTLRDNIRGGRDLFVKEAQEKYKSAHPDVES